MPHITLKKEIFNPAFLPHLEELRRFEILYGGAGSGKSVFLAQKKIFQHVRDNNRKTLVIRKVGATLRHSAFAELKGIIYRWNLGSLFNIRSTTMDIENPAKRNSFVFTGMDDVEKIKSIMGVTDIWIEETTDCTKEDIMQLNLRMRGKSQYMFQMSMTFNPISALHWIKPFFFDDTRRRGPGGDTAILKTTYLDNKFIDDVYKGQIEALKDQDPNYYQIYGLGNWGVLGNMVYSNYVVQDFDRDAFTEKQTYQGVDWGFNDPSIAVQVGFKDDVIYIRRGIQVTEKTNLGFMEIVEQGQEEIQTEGRDAGAMFRRDILSKAIPIIADSSEPARIKEWGQKGWNIRASKKFAGSIQFRLDWCKRHKIVIHPTIPDFLKEIQSYVYRQDRDGNVLDEPVDFNDHWMDGFGYALEPVMKDRRLKFSRR